MKMIFIGGPQSPSGFQLGYVYNMRKSHLGFSWWKEAPKDSEIGQRYDVIEVKKPVTPSPPHKKATLSRGKPNQQIKFTDGRLAHLRFVKCKSAPSGYEEGETVWLPKRYERFPWWQPA